MSETLTETEVETLRKGAMGAGLLVSVSDQKFFDTFKEAGTLAKHVARAKGNSASPVAGRPQKVTEPGSASRPLPQNSNQARSRRCAHPCCY
jgi:hypothetical protein